MLLVEIIWVNLSVQVLILLVPSFLFFIEAWEAKETIQSAISVNSSRLIVAGDSIQVIQSLSNKDKLPWCIDSILSDVGIEIVGLEEVSFRHIGREGNKAVDFMASKGTIL